MNDVTLPIELAETKLTLDEIGAIFVLYSMNKVSDESKLVWSKDAELSLITKDLIGMGVISIKESIDGPILNIDIRELRREEPDFWSIEDHDDFGNTIYSKEGHWGDEDSKFRYILTPRLESDEVIYSLSHTDFGLLANFVRDKEEGEKIVRLELEQELLDIKREDLKKSDGKR
jgi:hypothetical protein